MVSDKNTKGAAANPADAPAAPTPEELQALGRYRETMLSRLGQVVLLFSGVTRYAHQPISELHRLCLTPLMRDRIAIAMGKRPEDAQAPGLAAPLLGLAVWANVSEEVDAKIREQVREGVFPVRMNTADWNSGDIVWLLDVVAPSRDVAKGVLASFRTVLRDKGIDLPGGKLHLHPVIKKTMGEDALKAMGAMTAADFEARETAMQDAKGESLH